MLGARSVNHSVILKSKTQMNADEKAVNDFFKDSVDLLLLSAFISVHLRSPAFTCVHLRSPAFICVRPFKNYRVTDGLAAYPNELLFADA